MNTVQKNDVLSNTNLSISHDGGCLSSDAGLVLVKQVQHLLGFKRLTNQYLSIFMILVPILNTVIQAF